MTDHYATLGVPRDASPDQIKAARRRLASSNHPDRLNGDGQERMAEINRAYDVLSDPVKREAYDRTGTDAGAGQDPDALARARMLALFDAYLAQDNDHVGDLVEMFRNSVQGHIAQMRDQQRQAERKIAKLERERGRLKGPGDAFTAIADRRLLEKRQLAARLKDEIDLDERILVLLNEWKDVMPPPPPQFVTLGSTSTASGLGGLFTR